MTPSPSSPTASEAPPSEAPPSEAPSSEAPSSEAPSSEAPATSDSTTPISPSPPPTSQSPEPTTTTAEPTTPAVTTTAAPEPTTTAAPEPTTNVPIVNPPTQAPGTTQPPSTPTHPTSFTLPFSSIPSANPTPWTSGVNAVPTNAIGSNLPIMPGDIGLGPGAAPGVGPGSPSGPRGEIGGQSTNSSLLPVALGVSIGAVAVIAAGILLITRHRRSARRARNANSLYSDDGIGSDSYSQDMPFYPSELAKPLNNSSFLFDDHGSRYQLEALRPSHDSNTCYPPAAALGQSGSHSLSRAEPMLTVPGHGEHLVLDKSNGHDPTDTRGEYKEEGAQPPCWTDQSRRSNASETKKTNVPPKSLHLPNRPKHSQIAPIPIPRLPTIEPQTELFIDSFEENAIADEFLSRFRESTIDDQDTEDIAADAAVAAVATRARRFEMPANRTRPSALPGTLGVPPSLSSHGNGGSRTVSGHFSTLSSRPSSELQIRPISSSTVSSASTTRRV